MEPVASWSKERVTEWLKGLDAPLQQYPLSEWELSGLDLLQLSSSMLENIGVHKIGHQELILEAVEKLCALTYSVGGDSLRSLTEKLRAVAHNLQMNIQGRWRVNSNDAQSATNLPQQVLQAVVDVIIASNALVSVLNRNQFEQQTGYTANVKVAALCKGLDTTVHKETAVFEKEKDIISICRQLVAVCDEILTVSPLALLTHTAQLESVDLVPVSPGDHVGIEITTTGSRNHFVTGTPTEFPAEICEKILEGDEVIQVNGQIVVGWSRKNLVKKLEENPDGVTLVVRRLPGFLKHKESRAKSEREEPEEEEEEEEKNRHSLLGRVAASVRSLSFSEDIQAFLYLRSATDGIHHFRREKSALTSDQSSNEYQSSTLKRLQSGTDSLCASRNSLEVKISTERSPSPQELNRSSTSSCPDMAGLREEKENKKSSTKGMQTAMSRRRVSCRELGRPDCDGWLWKKRKEAGVFMTQKWQRFWFVLKGPTLYWYTSQQEEKAEGLIKIGSYNIESAGEHKRKYVFKMCHPRFQNFFFAAENVTDMSKWINCLITAIQKHKKYAQSQPDSEEDCYSETESEEESSRSPLPHRKKVNTKTQSTQSNTLPRTKGKQNRTSEPITISKATGSKIAGSVDEMDEMFNSLKKGGVTLIGQNQPMTHDQLRKSFIKRNKNPVINEKIHTLRALQSTLKAKEAELHLINRILEHSDFSPLKYRQWKQFNEELLQDIEKLHKQKDSPSTDTVNKASDDARAMSLSDGEQLVDAEAPDDGGSTPTNTQVPMQTQTTDTDETSTESYFFI